MPASKHTKDYELALRLYTGEQSTPEEIAALLGLKLSTLKQWKEKFQWDTYARIQSISTRSLVMRFYGMIDQLNQQIECKIQADESIVAEVEQLTKLAKCVDLIVKNDDNPTRLNDMLKNMLSWLAKYCDDEDFIKQFIKQQRLYLEDKLDEKING